MEFCNFLRSLKLLLFALGLCTDAVKSFAQNDDWLANICSSYLYIVKFDPCKKCCVPYQHQEKNVETFKDFTISMPLHFCCRTQKIDIFQMCKQ